MTIRFVAILAATSVVCFSSSGWAATGDRIGGAVVITNIVTADFAAKQRKLAVGDDVRQDDTIEVNADAQGEFRLDDNTKLALGPGARLVLDTFVYNGDQKTGSVILNLAKGAFRFITGVAAKPTYVINTPNASITVRGTIFDVFILKDNSVWVLLHEGALEATGSKNVCHVLDRPGQLVRIGSDGAVAPPVNWSQLPGNASVAFDTAFPFVTNTPSIDPNPLLSRDAIINTALPPEAEKSCLNPHPFIKTQKADTGPSAPAPKPKPKVKTQQTNQDVYVGPKRKPKPTKTVKGNDEDWGNGARGMDIILGGGMGGFGGRPNRGYDGGKGR